MYKPVSCMHSSKDSCISTCNAAFAVCTHAAVAMAEDYLVWMYSSTDHGQPGVWASLPAGLVPGVLLQSTTIHFHSKSSMSVSWISVSSTPTEIYHGLTSRSRLPAVSQLVRCFPSEALERNSVAMISHKRSP